MLTLGDPFYAGFGVTLDVHSFAEIQRSAFPSCCRFRPDPGTDPQFPALPRCATATPAHPLLVDRSEENAIRLAGSIEAAALSALAARSPAPALA